ncbi:MAG: hypothetical protein ACSHX0_06470 [Akkermansiaceae bacterium]
MPPSFQSHETDKPFTHCCDCACDLSDTDMYIVNQSYAGSECVFEFAMCFECRENMNAQLSEESRVAMFDFMHDNADMEARIESLGEDSETGAYIADCLTCGKERDQAKGYTLGALFTGDQLVKGPFPMMICDDCELKLADSISTETREVWDKFIADNFPAPPTDAELPQYRKPVLL